MPFKINISGKDGKTWKLEAEAPALVNKELGQTVKGEDVSGDLAGYELEITGLTDKSGFISLKDVQGVGLKKVLLDYGQGMHRRPKGDKKKSDQPAGLRLRKTVRGKVISDAISQINTKVVKEGSKALSEVFADQNKKPEAAPEESETKEAPTAEEKKEEAPKEEKPEAVAVEDKEAPAEAKPDQEPQQKPAPTDAKPDKEPTESEASKEEKAHPDEEPKS